MQNIDNLNEQVNNSGSGVDTRQSICIQYFLRSTNVYKVFEMFKKTLPVFALRLYSTHLKPKVTVTRPIIYGDEASPPVRFVLMTASALSVDIDYREIDLFAGKHKTDFFKKINPLQKVPAMVSQGQVTCDSHAISLYLCNLSKDENLYPKDTYAQARINELLFFNCGTLFPIDSEIFTDYFARRWPVNQLKLDVLYSALDHLEFHLNKNIWLTGDKMRLSDICLLSTVSSIYEILPELDRHQKINKWLKRCETLPFFEINRCGLVRLRKFIRAMEHYN